VAEQQAQAPGAEEEIENKAPTDPNGAATEAGTEDASGDESQPSPYDDLAQKMGWVPRDQFNGPPEQWKPAEQFILDGRDIQRETARELKVLRGTVDTIGRTSATIVQQEVERRMDALRAQHEKAVDEGDTEGALRIADEMGTLKARVSAPAGPSAAAQSFAEENQAWFRKDPLATARALEVTNTLARQGYDEATQLRYAKETVEREYPHLFGKGNNGTPAKPQAGVHAPGSRAAGPGAKAEKKYVDMPKAARDVADDFVARGVLPDKEAYAKQYWQNEQRTQ
jgi:hypothetical protein